MGKGAHGDGGGGHSGGHSGGGDHHHHHHHPYKPDNVRGRSSDCAELAYLLVFMAVCLFIAFIVGVLESTHGVVWKTVFMLFIMLLAVLCLTMYCCCLRAGCCDDEEQAYTMRDMMKEDPDEFKQAINQITEKITKQGTIKKAIEKLPDDDTMPKLLRAFEIRFEICMHGRAVQI